VPAIELAIELVNGTRQKWVFTADLFFIPARPGVADDKQGGSELRHPLLRVNPVVKHRSTRLTAISRHLETTSGMFYRIFTPGR